MNPDLLQKRGRCGFARGLLPLIALMSLAACAGDDGAGVSYEPVVIPRPTPGQPSAPGARGRAAGISLEDGRALLTRAMDHEQAGDYNSALLALADLADRRPPLELAEEVQRRRMAVKRHLLQSVYVDALIVLDGERVTLGDQITGELMLVNLSDKRLVIPAMRVLPATARGPRTSGRREVARGESRTTILTDMQYAEYTAEGSVVRQRQVGPPFTLPADLVLEPGERHSWPIKRDTLSIRPSSVALREYTFSATLYPADIRIGEESFPGTLEFRKRVCRVFPRNYEDLLDDPLARLVEVIHKQSPPHIPLAAALVPEDQRAEAVRRIRAFLEAGGGVTLSGPVRTACCVGLRMLTGLDLPADPETWIDELEKSSRPSGGR